METYKVNEIFYSLQGEGSCAGTPMVFVRFSGCNLHCEFCDTKHEEGEDLTAGEILHRVIRSNPGPILSFPRICFTGGEPTLQIGSDLPAYFQKRGFSLHLETNGSVPISSPLCFSCITISPKIPDIPHNNFLFLHREIIRKTELKIVYNTKDMSLTNNLIEVWGGKPFGHKYIQPCDWGEGLETEEAIKFVKSNPEWRLSVQLQKLLKIT